MAEKKKILYICHGHPDFSPGGGEWAAWYMYRAMKDSDQFEPYFLARYGEVKHQHPGTYIMRHESDPTAYLLYTNGAGYNYFYETFISADLSDARMVHRAFRELLLTLKPDIIHFHHYLHMGVDLIGYAKRLLPEVKILMTLHEYIPICAHMGSMIKAGSLQLCYKSSFRQCERCFPNQNSRDFFLRERFFKANFALVDQFISPSHFLKDRYAQWGLAPEKIMVMDNGRPIWTPRPRVPRAPGQPFVAGFFGQIVFHKGVDVFLKAAAEYRRRRQLARRKEETSLPEVRFAIHGVMGHLPAALKKTIEELLESCQDVVQFHGAYESRHMPELLTRVDSVIIPSIWWENSPLTIQEAFMAGVPIICSNIGGMAEKVTHDVNGLHFVVGDHFDLLAQILRLAGSAELHERLCQGIPPVISDREMAEQMHEVYGRLLAASTGESNGQRQLEPSLAVES